MGSGLVYIIIVGMWISYFLPRWISNHDEVSGRSMERFADAMKKVGSTTGKITIDVDELIGRRKSQLITRRILFTSIIGFTVLVALFILVGLISPVILTIPISSFALYLVHARHQIQTVTEEMELAKNAQQMEEKKSKEGYSELIARSKRAAQQLTITDSEQWTPLGDRKNEGESSGITILPKGSAQGQGTWQPAEIPAPSYSRAPKAAPQRKIIDLTIPGAWSSAHESAAQEVSPQRDEELFDQESTVETDEKIRRDKAANE